MAQIDLLTNRVTALDGITSSIPSSAAIPSIQADLNGLHDTINQLTLTIQTDLNATTTLVTTLQGVVNQLLGGAGITVPKYTVVGLPAGVEGQIAYATNGRKVGQGVGSGTGVPVYFSSGSWRVYSTDAVVQA